MDSATCHRPSRFDVRSRYIHKLYTQGLLAGSIRKLYSIFRMFIAFHLFRSTSDMDDDIWEGPFSKMTNTDSVQRLLAIYYNEIHGEING